MRSKNRINIIALTAACLLAALACSSRAFAPQQPTSPPTPTVPDSVDYAPGDHRLTIVVEGSTREYVVHIPPQYDGQVPLPVVIMFHGGGGAAQAAMEETGWAEKADQEGFLAVFPEGTPPDPSRPASFLGNPQTWNDGSERGIGAVESKVADVEFVSAMIDDLKERFNVDDRRIYVTGFSNGASMSFRLAHELSSVIAAIAPVAGADWLDDTMLDRAVPLLYMTGTADPLNPIEGGEIFIGERSYGVKPPTQEMIAKWVKLHGCGEEPRVVYDQDGAKGVAYDCPGDADTVVLYTLDGHGHHWPGSRTVLPETMAGKNTAKIKATDVIWDFFEKHAIGIKEPTAHIPPRGLLERTIEHDNIQRTYIQYVPPQYDHVNSVPLVLFLHGAVGQGKNWISMNMDDFADKHGFILIAPDGFRTTWNAGKWQTNVNGEEITSRCCGPARDRSIDDVGFISRLLDTVESEYKVDPKRIYVTGISNGGVMAYRLACDLSERIAAVAPVAPPAVPEPCNANEVSVMHILGTEDKGVRIEGGKVKGTSDDLYAQPAQEMIDTWIEINHCSLSANPPVVFENGGAVCVSYGPCQGDTDVQYCKVEGMGHTYPSGIQYASEALVGPVSYDMSFDDIWNFFEKHTK
jgi:polyhydroxybutyrate depolymerase